MDTAKRNTKLTFKQLYRNKRISKPDTLLNAQTLQLKISLVLPEVKYIGIAKVKNPSTPSSNCS